MTNMGNPMVVMVSFQSHGLVNIAPGRLRPTEKDECAEKHQDLAEMFHHCVAKKPPRPWKVNPLCDFGEVTKPNPTGLSA